MKYILLSYACCLAVLLNGCGTKHRLLSNIFAGLPDSLSLEAGTSKVLNLKGPSDDIKWSSSDTSVATIGERGRILAFRPGLISIKGTNGSGVSAIVAVSVKPARLSDVGVGADGSVFVVGASPLAGGGYPVYQVIEGGFHKLPGCGAVRIAVSPKGIPWVVTASDLIYRLNGTGWERVPGKATDIAIGADGHVFAIGIRSVSPTGGYNIMRWTGTGWKDMIDCAGVRIAVGYEGWPLVVNKSGIVYRYTGNILWEPVDGIEASDIGTGPDGSVFATEAENIITHAPQRVFQLQTDSWRVVKDAVGSSISVGPGGKAWWIDSSGYLHNQ